MVRSSWYWCGQLSWYVVLGSCGVRWCVCAPVASEVTLGVLVLGGHRHHGFPSPPSLLYHSYFPSIVESGLSVVVVNLLWLWPCIKNLYLAYTMVSRSRLLSFSSCQMSSHPYLYSEAFSSESLGPRCSVFVWKASTMNRRGKGAETELDEHQARRALRCKLLLFSFSLV